MPSGPPLRNTHVYACFEPRCSRHSNPYRTSNGFRKHLESVLKHLPDRQSKRGEVARYHDVSRVLKELQLDTPEENRPDKLQQSDDESEQFTISEPNASDIEAFEEVIEVASHQHTQHRRARSVTTPATGGSASRTRKQRDSGKNVGKNVRPQAGQKNIMQIIDLEGPEVSDAGGKYSKENGCHDDFFDYAARGESLPELDSAAVPNQIPAVPELDGMASTTTASLTRPFTEYPPEPGPNNTATCLTSLHAVQAPDTPSYRLRIFIHHKYAEVGGGQKILVTSEYPTFSAISEGILTSLPPPPTIYSQQVRWKVKCLTVVTSAIGGNRKYNVWDEGGWRAVTQNILPAESPNEMVEVLAELEMA